MKFLKIFSFLFLTLLFEFSYSNAAVIQFENTIEKINSSSNITFDFFEKIYQLNDSIQKVERTFHAYQDKIIDSDKKLINELAYIYTLIRRVPSENCFRLLRTLKTNIPSSNQYANGVYHLVYAKLMQLLKKNDKAVEENIKSINFLKNSADKKLLKLAYINQGFFYTSIKSDENRILKYFKLAEDLEKNGIMEHAIVLRTNYAFYYILQNNPQKALEYCNDAESIIKNQSQTNFYDKYRVLIIMANIYFTLGDVPKSDVYLGKAKEIAIKYNMIELRKEIDNSQSYRYANRNDFKNAYYLVREADSLAKVIAYDKISETVAVYDLQYKIKEEREAKKKLILIISIVVFALIVITILWINIRVKHKILIKQNIQLAQKEQVRTVMSHELETDKEKIVSLELIVELEKLMFDKKYFEKQNLTIEKLAKKLNTNRTYLSDAINTYYHKNYSTWINEIRIDAARKMLASKKFDHFSIEGISNLAGFSSISSFNSIFKKITGITPSQFKKSRDENVF